MAVIVLIFAALKKIISFPFEVVSEAHELRIKMERDYGIPSKLD